jgi:hypothetical protein
MHAIDPTDDLPYRGMGPAFIFLETEHDQALADEVARMYPGAPRQTLAASDGGKPLVDEFRLDPQLLSVHRGLTATYRGADGASVERLESTPDVTADQVPVALPAKFAWRGILAVDVTGEYALRVTPGVQMRLDDQPVPQVDGGGARLRLARGSHAFEVSGSIDATHPARLEWRPPGKADWQVVPTGALFVAPAGGTGLQLTLASVTNTTVDESIDPVIAHYYHRSPFSRLHVEPGVWTAEWVGHLIAPSTGRYAFSLNHSHSAGVWIDDQQILGNLEGASDTLNKILDLSSGPHHVRVRFEKSADGSPWLYLSWTPPGAPSAPIPTSALLPPPPEFLGPAN